jgi:WD40 repeat protein
VLTGGADGHVRVWDHGKLLHTFPERTGMTYDIAVADFVAASVSNDGTVRVWDPQSGRSRGMLPGTAFALAGEELVTGGADGGIAIWSLATGTVRGTIEGNGEAVGALAVSPGGEHLMATPRLDGDARLFRFATGELLGSVPAGRAAKPRFGPPGVLLTGDGAMRMFGVPSLAFRYGQMVAFPDAVAVGADWRLAVAATFEEPVVLDVHTGRVLRVLAGADPVQAVAVSADSRFAATGGWQRRVQIWDLDTGELVRTLDGHRADVAGIVWNDDATTLVTTDLSPAVYEWKCDWDYRFG